MFGTVHYEFQVQYPKGERPCEHLKQPLTVYTAAIYCLLICSAVFTAANFGRECSSDVPAATTYAETQSIATIITVKNFLPMCKLFIYFQQKSCKSSY